MDREPEQVEELLARGALSVIGGIRESSNAALVVHVTAADSAVAAIVKPIEHERALWDFPDGTLAGREVAAYRLARAAGLTAIPPTVLRDTPWGPASVQWWVGTPGEPLECPVFLGLPHHSPAGWRVVLTGTDADGHELVLAHEDDPDLADIALLDAVLNNTDRKASHLARHAGQLWAFDHGLCLSADPKLRTVLWGWAAEPFDDRQRGLLERWRTELTRPEVAGLLGHLLTPLEVRALTDRVDALHAEEQFPVPRPGWPALPWPLF